VQYCAIYVVYITYFWFDHTPLTSQHGHTYIAYKLPKSRHFFTPVSVWITYFTCSLSLFSTASTSMCFPSSVSPYLHKKHCVFSELNSLRQNFNGLLHCYVSCLGISAQHCCIYPTTHFKSQISQCSHSRFDAVG